MKRAGPPLVVTDERSIGRSRSIPFCVDNLRATHTLNINSHVYHGSLQWDPGICAQLLPLSESNATLRLSTHWKAGLQRPKDASGQSSLKSNVDAVRRPVCSYWDSRAKWIAQRQRKSA